jgi:hypothetical protein
MPAFPWYLLYKKKCSVLLKFGTFQTGTVKYPPTQRICHPHQDNSPLCVRIKRFDTHRHTSTHGSSVVQLIASSLYQLHCPRSRNFQSHWREEWSWNRDGKWLNDRSIDRSINQSMSPPVWPFFPSPSLESWDVPHTQPSKTVGWTAGICTATPPCTFIERCRKRNDSLLLYIPGTTH